MALCVANIEILNTIPFFFRKLNRNNKVKFIIFPVHSLSCMCECVCVLEFGSVFELKKAISRISMILASKFCLFKLLENLRKSTSFVFKAC